MKAQGDGIARRVRAALRERGRQQGELAEAVGLSQDKLSKSLNGRRSFTTGELVEISENLDLDVHWLISGEAGQASTRVAYRHHFDRSAGVHVPPTSQMRRSLDAVRTAYVQADLPSSGRFEELRACLAESIGAEGVTWEVVRSLACRVRNMWDDWRRERASEDPVLGVGRFLDEAMGIDLVVVEADENPRTQTYALQVGDRRMIVVETTAAWYSALFGIFHELAHHLFDDLRVGAVGSEEGRSGAEAFANGFAANVLLPQEHARGIAADSDPSALAQHLWEAGVGIAAFRRRCDALSLEPSSDWSAQFALSQRWEMMHPQEAKLRRQLWRAPSFPSPLVQRHRHLVERGEVPPETLAWMLQIPVEDLEPPAGISVEDGEVQALLEQLGVEA